MLTKESNEFIKELKPKMKSKDLLEINQFNWRGRQKISRYLIKYLFN